jgi:hypothetical protein
MAQRIFKGEVKGKIVELRFGLVGKQPVTSSGVFADGKRFFLRLDLPNKQGILLGMKGEGRWEE